MTFIKSTTTICPRCKNGNLATYENYKVCNECMAKYVVFRFLGKQVKQN